MINLIGRKFSKRAVQFFLNYITLYDLNFIADEIINRDRSARDNVTGDVRCGFWDYNVKGFNSLASKEGKLMRLG